MARVARRMLLYVGNRHFCVQQWPLQVAVLVGHCPNELLHAALVLAANLRYLMQAMAIRGTGDGTSVLTSL